MVSRAHHLPPPAALLPRTPRSLRTWGAAGLALWYWNPANTGWGRFCSRRVRQNPADSLVGVRREKNIINDDRSFVEAKGDEQTEQTQKLHV